MLIRKLVFCTLITWIALMGTVLGISKALDGKVWRAFRSRLASASAASSTTWPALVHEATTQPTPEAWLVHPPPPPMRRLLPDEVECQVGRTPRHAMLCCMRHHLPGT